MPALADHEKISRILTGKPATNIHQTIDLPFLLEKYRKHLSKDQVTDIYAALRQPDSQYTKGHRQAFHTPLEAYIIGHILDNETGAINALLHILADETFNTAESKQLLKLLGKP